MMMGGWGYGYGPNGWMMNGGYWWVGIIMMLVQVLFWVGIIFLAVRLIRHLSSRPHGNRYMSDSALDILRDRYAKGEIDSDEFNRRKKDLQG